MSIPALRRRDVLELAHLCEWHQTHSEHVTALCLNLFDGLQSLHQLGEYERELVEYASLLHDIGWHVSGKRHHKHSMSLIVNSQLGAFEEHEIAIIANIARYHRKSIPKSTHAEYVSLSAEARRVVSVGAAFLRIADGLDRSHACIVRSLMFEIGKRKVRCALDARADADDEIRAAQRKSDLFEETFGRSIEFQTIRTGT